MENDPLNRHRFKPQLLKKDSLHSGSGRTQFIIGNPKERIAVHKVISLSFDGRFISDKDFIFITSSKVVRKPEDINEENPLVIGKEEMYQVIARNVELRPGPHNVRLVLHTDIWGEIIIDVTTSVSP